MPPDGASEPTPRLQVGLAALAGVALLVLSVPGVHWQLGTPRLGVSVETPPGGEVVVTGVQAGGTAARVGVRPGDTLLAVGSVGLSGRGEGMRGPEAALHDVVNRYREGESADWVISRDGRERTLSGPFAGMPESVIVSRVVVLGVFWLLAWFLLWARPDRRNARHLVYTIFAMTASVIFLVNRRMAIDTPLGFTLVQVSNLGLFVAPALVIHFGVIFPVSTLSDRTRRWLLRGVWGLYFVVVYAVHQALFVRGLLSPDAPYMLQPSWLEALRYGQISLWLHVGDYLVCAALMLWTYTRVEADDVRDRIKWVLWAVALTAALDGLGMGAALYSGAIEFADLYPHRNYLYLLIAGGLLIAIFRHDLFDVDRVIRGTVVYFGTVGALFALFAATEALVSQALTEVLPTRSDTAGTATAAVLSGALFQPLRTWIRARMLELVPVDPEEEVLMET